jgi:hypothetical protein
VTTRASVLMDGDDDDAGGGGAFGAGGVGLPVKRKADKAPSGRKATG